MGKFKTQTTNFVSVVIPVKNGKAFIKEALASLFNQTEFIQEIIVVDDGSTDSTCELVEDLTKIDSRVKLYKFDSNQGVSAARNYGIRVAGGAWILFLDGDDLVDEKLLTKQLACVQQLENQGYDDVLLVHSAYQQIDAEGKKIGGITRWKQLLPHEVFGYYLLRNHIITASGVLVRKDVLMEIGGFNQKIHYAEDWDLWLKIARKGGFGYIDEPLVFVRRHGKNASNSLKIMLEGEKRILGQYTLSTIQKAIFQRNLADEVNYVDYAAMLFRLEKLSEGHQALLTALTCNPIFATGHFYLGIYYLKLQDWEKAQQCFEQTLKLNKNNTAALNNLGALLAAKGNKNEALLDFNQAMKLSPGYLDAKKNEGLVAGLHEGCPTYNEVQFTWRELRPVLLAYSE